MRVRRDALIALGILMAIFQWSCKQNNIVGTGVPATATITGTVTSANPAGPVAGAMIAFSYGGTKDSVVTASDGTFKFVVEVDDTAEGVDVSIIVRKPGFVTDTFTSISVKGDQQIQIVLNLDLSTYAIVTGAVQDSATSYALRGASVLISLPGVVDSATTLQDGSFTVYVDLENLSSITATMTVTKAGFKTYHGAVSLKKGTNRLSPILLPIDQSSAYAHIVGRVTDARTGQPLTDVSVLLSSALAADSTRTMSDGSYSFDINLQGPSSISGKLFFSQSGFQDTTMDFSVNAGQTTTLNVALPASMNYAIITGTVRDSVSSYPLAGATVIISLPADGNSSSKFMTSLKSRNRYSVSSFILDSTTTLVDGSFSIAVNLVDLNSLSATMTVSKAGFVTYQAVQTFQKGTNSLGNILLKIDNSSTFAHITGSVTDSHSRMPITGVSVLLTSPIIVDSTKTLNDGSYSFNLNLHGLTSISGTLLFRLNSYNDTTVSFTANGGKTSTQTIYLSAKSTVVGGDSSTGRGVARSIALVSVSHQEISVHGVGGNETSVLVWQVLDSLGFPLDIDHRDTVAFVPAGIPVSSGDPAYVTPTLGITDGSGQVSTTVNSGTVAGTIQLIAKLQLGSGKIVQSSPVLVTVDGGLPDQSHFSINLGENQSNIRANNVAGYEPYMSENTLTIPVQVGDKYGNPVHPGTAIYFTTTGGIVTGASQTDATGHAAAMLYTGNPLPKLSGLNPTLYGNGTGYGYVKAYTQGEDGVIVSDSTMFLFSAATAPILVNDSVSISPIALTLNSGSVSIPVRIADRFGNPLEPGTEISTTVTIPPPPPSGGGNVYSVNATGLPSTLADYLTRGFGSTDFTLTIAVAQTQGTATATPFSVTLLVSGRNGTQQFTINGVARP